MCAVKHCVKLRESAKYRREVGAALVSGADLVRELAECCGPYRALVGLSSEDNLPHGELSSIALNPPGLAGAGSRCWIPSASLANLFHSFALACAPHQAHDAFSAPFACCRH